MLPSIFQLYHGGQFYLWWKSEDPGTPDSSTNKADRYDIT